MVDVRVWVFLESREDLAVRTLGPVQGQTKVCKLPEDSKQGYCFRRRTGGTALFQCQCIYCVQDLGSVRQRLGRSGQMATTRFQSPHIRRSSAIHAKERALAVVGGSLAQWQPRDSSHESRNRGGYSGMFLESAEAAVRPSSTYWQRNENGVKVRVVVFIDRVV